MQSMKMIQFLFFCINIRKICGLDKYFQHETTKNNNGKLESGPKESTFCQCKLLWSLFIIWIFSIFSRFGSMLKHQTVFFYG